MRPRVLVLGAQFAGLAALHHLARRFSSGALEVTVVADRPVAVYRPDLIWALSDPGRLAALRIPLPELCRRLGARFVLDVAYAIDPAARLVQRMNGSPLAYDTLFWATGAPPAWDAVPGLGPDCGHLCADFGVRHLAQAILADRWEQALLAQGPLVQDPAARPRLAAPNDLPLVEAALLLAGRARGRPVTLLTPAAEAGEALGPRARAALRQALAQAGVAVRTEVIYRHAGPHHVEVETGGRRERLAADLLIWTPPLAGSDLARASHLDDGFGWVPTGPYLQHRDWPEIYVLGDLGRETLPKAAHAALQQARVAVDHFAARLRGGPVPAPVRPKVIAALYLGPGRGLIATSDILYGGRREYFAIGRWCYLAKRLTGWLYCTRGGRLPVMP